MNASGNGNESENENENENASNGRESAKEIVPVPVPSIPVRLLLALRLLLLLLHPTLLAVAALPSRHTATLLQVHLLSPHLPVASGATRTTLLPPIIENANGSAKGSMNSNANAR